MKKANVSVIIVCCVVAAALILGAFLLVIFQDNAPDFQDIDASDTQPGSSLEIETEVDRFDAFIDEIFADWVTSDTLTMNYYLADPEAMGIERPAPTYGRVMTPELFEEEREKTTEISLTLDSFEYDRLRSDQQIIFDIIELNIELSMILEREEDFTYYTGYIRPLTGIQVQLPILLAEFNFYTPQDIEIYLALLEDTVRYFDDIIAFESERAVRGFFMRDSNLDTVIESIELFIGNREENLLITVFDDRIDAYPELETSEREAFKQRNLDLVQGNVLVAYDSLLSALTSLRGVGPMPGGLALLPSGAEFAHAQLCFRAGTDRTAQEVEAMISEWREATLFRIRSILANDSMVMEKYVDGTIGQISDGTPEEYLKILQDTIMQLFPPIETTEHTVMEVHESLQEHTSPAFFLKPAVDSFDHNVIYINPSAMREQDNLYLFTVLAHEGYPGHLYEMVHFRQQSPHPIRVMLTTTGYSEGWATYVELLSYNYAGLDAIEAEFLSEMSLYFTLLQSHIDIGVNLLGWGIDEVAGLLYADLGIEDMETVEAYYDLVTGVPLNITMYALGYIEFALMREEAEASLGDAYSLYGFHSFILEIGPAPFPIIRKELNNR